MKKVKELLINFINGLCMAFADSVPGVSGGTVAFILGFYDKLVISLDELFRGNFSQKKKALKYLFKIGIGWVFGLLVAISLLSDLFNSHIYEMSSLFIGFIIIAIPIVIKEEKECLKKYSNIIFLFLGAILVVTITYLNRSTGMNYDFNNYNLITFLYVFLAASLAISAMILPGISGSTILLIFGVYIPIINKIKDFLHFDFTTIPILCAFGLGMIFGIVAFTKFLRKSLDKKRSATIYTILGMMIASIYAIIMGPTTLEETLSPLSPHSFNIWFFLLGGVLILSLEGLKKLLEKDENNE